MPLLAIDGATPVAGAALIDKGEVRAEIFNNQGRGHAQTLMGLVDKVLEMGETTAEQLDALAVTVGPGSFTGLRIGMATVKGLAMALDLPVIGVSTLKVLAEGVSLAPALIVPVLNARKGEVYTALYRGGLDGLTSLGPEMAVGPEALTRIVREELERTGHAMALFTGDGVDPYLEVWEQQLGDVLLLAPSYLNRPRAVVLGVLADQMYHKEEFSDPINLVPTYIRLSEAEYRLQRQS